MIEFVTVMFRALTGLKLTFPTLISLSLFFAMGYYFAALTKRMNPLKAVLVLFLGYLLSTILEGMLGVFTLAVVLGFLSNQGLFLARAFMWVESLTELIIVLKHRATFEDIRQEEQRGSTRQEQPRPKQERSHGRAKGNQKNQKSGRQKPKDSQDSWSPKKGNPPDIAKARKILEIEASEELTEKQIKKAYRRLAIV